MGMINGINYINSINKTPQNAIYNSLAFKGNNNADTFERKNNKIEEKLSYAISKITDSLKHNRTEYMVIINPDGSVHESQGDEHKCSMPYSCIKEGAVSMHGHPEKLPLSSGDIAGLLTSSCISETAFTVDGKYSKLTKRTWHNYSPSDFGRLYAQFEKELCLMALDKMGIDYHYSQEDIIDMCADIHPIVQTKNFEETVEYMKQEGQILNGTPDEMAQKLIEGPLSFKVLFDFEHKYDKAHNIIMNNYEDIKQYLNSEDGLITRNELVEKIADEYNLEYETNMF